MAGPPTAAACSSIGPASVTRDRSDVLRPGVLLEPQRQAAFARGIEQTVRFVNELLENEVVKWALERFYRDSRCGSVMIPWTAETCLDRLGRESLYEPGEEGD
ncbi:hypothetical protein [Reyranella soli]|uniref:Uncharacterized protein n=1 Tax=Reyranella soli TaxID=1230389 RepID=A0A512NPG5_9HYPH|nr:hypothetical protein [Reyranella soli]GEP60829.1 hypothetical protein RSO01_79950 [Reyranella soli]